MQITLPVGTNSISDRDIYYRCRCYSGGFTLVELLVVMGIIAILVGILLPAMQSARRAAGDTRCASNIRQLAMGLINYSTAWNGAFPPNSVELGQVWFDEDLMGAYIRPPSRLNDGTVAGGVLVCPSDADDAIRSYSMNTFASSYVSSFVRETLTATPPRGQLFRAGVGSSLQMILVAESFAGVEEPRDSAVPIGYSSQAIIGWFGDRPGERFGAGNGITPRVSSGRYGPASSQIDYSRHRRAGTSLGITEPFGRAHVAFADGHVELLAHTDLADFSTGKSTYRAMWSVIDPEID